MKDITKPTKEERLKLFRQGKITRDELMMDTLNDAQKQSKN